LLHAPRGWFWVFHHFFPLLRRGFPAGHVLRGRRPDLQPLHERYGSLSQRRPPCNLFSPIANVSKRRSRTVEREELSAVDERGFAYLLASGSYTQIPGPSESSCLGT